MRAAFVLFGTIVGAGIFSLPYVVEKAGYLMGLFWMILLAGAVTLTHVLFGEVVLATRGQHRMVGYVGIHLGPFAKGLETLSSILSLFGSSLAYLILGGLFISQIVSRFAPFTPAWGAAVLFLIGLIVVRRGTRFLSGVDFWLTLVEMSGFLLLSFVAAKGFDASHLFTYDPTQAFLPYGVILFAYGGLTAVTEVHDIVGGDARKMRRSIVAGTLMAVALTILFVTAVVAALGVSITPEAVAGLSARFGGSLPLLGALAGFFSILTSYIVFTDYLHKQFRQDFKVGRFLSVAASVGIPFLLYLAGVRSFGRILELVGAVLVGIEGIFVAGMYLKIKNEGSVRVLRVPNALVYLLILAYTAGALYALLFQA